LVATLLFLRRRGEVPLGARFFLAEVGVGVAATCAAVNYWLITPWLNALQAQLGERYGAFHQADKTDPLFVQFDTLHQSSTTLFIVGFAATLICLVSMTQF
jgi:hypothetical protein